jgi:SH3-like domain-containing protein
MAVMTKKTLWVHLLAFGHTLSLCCFLALSLGSTTAHADDERLSRADLFAIPAKTGPSKLQVPRFVSFKRDTVNMRIGPSRNHAVDWVYRGYQGLPVLVIAESGHWRKVADHEGVSGWVHRALLTSTRTVKVEGRAPLGLHLAPDPQSNLKATVAPGATGHLKSCQGAWCRAVFSSLSGWVERSHLWGVIPSETEF